jgi:hypothetical protein
MQLPSSTIVSDPSLAALPQPAVQSTASGLTAADAPAVLGGFEALITNLTPNPAPRASVSAPGFAAPRVPVRAGLAAKAVASTTPAASAGASVAPAPLGLAAVVSFFGVDRPASVAEPGDPNEPVTAPVTTEKHRPSLPEVSAMSVAAPLPRLDPLPPMVLAAGEEKPLDVDADTLTNVPPTPADTSPLFSAPVPHASSRLKAGMYSHRGDALPVPPEDSAVETDASDSPLSPLATAPRPSSGRGANSEETPAPRPAKLATAGEKQIHSGNANGHEPANEVAQTPRATGLERAASAVGVALAGPAGEVAQGVPFAGTHKVTTPAAGEAVGASRVEQCPNLQAVRAAAAKFAAPEAETVIE